MNEKHFIWIVPMLLIIGFIIGYVSGLHIPKEITIRVEPNTLLIINKSFDERLICQDYKVNLSICEYELKRQISEKGIYWDNSFSLCPNGKSYKSVTCDCAKNTSTPCMTECFVCE